MAPESSGSAGLTPARALALLPGLGDGWVPGPVLHRGVASTSHLVTRGDECCVLRIDTPQAARLGLDRAGELEVLEAVSAAGLAPAPLAAHPGQGILATRYVDARAWDPADARRPASVRRIATALKTLHGLKPVGPRLSLRAVTSHYAALAGTGSAADLAAEVDILLRRTSVPDRANCLCHNDINPANILCARRLLLIDWEYSGIGDPDYDLAVAMHHLGLDGDMLEVFLAAYFGDRKRDPQRLQRFRALYDRVLLLWLAAVAAGDGLTTEMRREIRALEAAVDRRPLP